MQGPIYQIAATLRYALVALMQDNPDRRYQFKLRVQDRIHNLTIPSIPPGIQDREPKPAENSVVVSLQARNWGKNEESYVDIVPNETAGVNGVAFQSTAEAEAAVAAWCLNILKNGIYALCAEVVPEPAPEVPVEEPKQREDDFTPQLAANTPATDADCGCEGNTPAPENPVV